MKNVIVAPMVATEYPPPSKGIQPRYNHAAPRKLEMANPQNKELGVFFHLNVLYTVKPYTVGRAEWSHTIEKSFIMAMSRPLHSIFSFLATSQSSLI